ncbi:MAG: hypothetical protein HC888_01520 [Candidatus Competibacteraceae bacterium]|nr:hypothetical protein [Candidatus Competibacteraceae bacterium]
MSFSATIPAASVETANATLEGLGFGPNNFSRPTRTGSADATHAGLHSWGNAAFRAAVAALPGVQITDGAANTDVTFEAHCTGLGMEWTSQENWFVDPIMIGDQRTHDNKLWESLIDFNVWTPPIGWREIVVEGYPPWVQPTGAHDAYPLGFRVTYNGQNWENTGSAANVWQPGVFGWVVIP